MGGGVPPVIQVVKMRDLRGITGRESEREPESLEIGLNGLERGVSLADRSARPGRVLQLRRRVSPPPLARTNEWTA